MTLQYKMEISKKIITLPHDSLKEKKVSFSW